MIRAVLLDLAGVVYQGVQPLPGAAQSVAGLRSAGLRLLFLTNTTRMPRRALLRHLHDMGVETELLDIVDRNSEAGHQTELPPAEWSRLRIVTALSL